MSKRRLTRQQRERIAAKQEDQLSASTASENREKYSGLVISHFGQQLDIEPDPGSRFPPIIRCHQRANLPVLVTGDRVAWQAEGDDTGVVLAMDQRRSVFGRPDPGGQFRPLAANVDRVLVVIAPLPELFPNLIDRYLVAIEHLQLQAMLVLNKLDLLDDGSQQKIDNILSIYEGLGYETARVSALSGSGCQALCQALTGHTTVLVGQSGVGKSSLINALAGDQAAPVGDLSEAKYKGTHTTTATRLFHLPGFDVIDSPGIREFHLTHIDASAVLAGFPELRELAPLCKFRDCAHDQEPGCAIKAAVAKGEIEQSRLDSYFRICQSLDGAGP
ncbi:MAG: small ribosomal subunit biogenesis GTPase RsgA [Gammaproteobacteria bacterium]